MNPLQEFQLNMTRRDLLASPARPLGAAALASLAGRSISAAPQTNQSGLPGLPHFAPKARRVIYLFMAGGPSHIDTFDYHPNVRKLHGQELPASVRQGQRITGMTSGQKSFPVVAPMFKFRQHGKHGTWVSEILPHVS
ncbi:MAG: DUF1501 domain-containing protein, partial [Planctomycetaceae bacterium]